MSRHHHLGPVTQRTNDFKRTDQGHWPERTITTHRPEQVGIRAFADSLKLTVRCDNIHLEKIVDAKSETRRQDGMTTTLEVGRAFGDGSNAYRCRYTTY